MLAWILAHNTQPAYDPVLQHPCASYRLLDLMRQPLKKKGLPSLSRGCFSKIANTGSVYEGRRRQGGERRHMVVRNNNNNDLLHLFTAEAV